jgi:hypothetical protein
VEPNDDRLTANDLQYARCGRITVPPGSIVDGGESDWLTFEVTDASTGFRVYYEGQVHVIVETDGMAPKDISIPGQTIDFYRNQPYYIELRSLDGGTQIWRVLVKREP